MRFVLAALSRPVTVVMALVMVVVLALVVMVLLVTGRVIGTVARNCHTTAADRHHACNRKCRCDSLQHLCLLEDEFPVVACAPGPRETGDTGRPRPKFSCPGA